jgi:hypothetical protein
MPSTKPQRTKAPARIDASTAKRPAARIPVGNVPNRALVDALAARLRQPPASPDHPLVVVNRISQTKSVHILVIWNKWKDLAIAQRARVIADAFATAFPDDHSVVRLPLGLTPGEALSQGYLRYLIVPLVRPADKVTARQLNEAMASAGGILMRIGSDQRLRFATREQAEEAYRRLLEKINKPIWTLSEESSTSDMAE